MSLKKETFTFIAATTPTAFLERFKNYYGPTMNAFEAAEKNGKADELFKELQALFLSQNKTGNNESTLIPATFLKITAIK